MIVGLTGGIASGKSSVTRLLKEYGIAVIDADLVAREVVEAGEEAYQKIVDHFGETILASDKTIARKKLGEIVFNDEEERNALNAIVHPAIRKRMLEQKESYEKEGRELIVYDLPLLFENELTHMVEKIILVYVDADVQLQRLMERDQSTREEALSRIRSQMPIAEKLSLADEVIDNNGSRDETKQQLLEILKKWNITVHDVD
ncbi:dephospho-CoA kinase [Desertibacillus haloalkaliphilus]|uniref:dephospho-CoA kinase n=1 Tax=Desertibacillus haloalkaliphilus TaxID=1328930 RepID=UPI001C261EA4|nr:dephospho-CoA kinase [Desertibacillus haloalkaliphilus]MBU8905145.1 dephospho-CoA kinase [Desertibacillus haloalkaliphilus]